MAQNLIVPGNTCILSPIIEDSIEDALINKYGEHWRNRKSLFLKEYNALKTGSGMYRYKEDIPYFYSMYYLPMNISRVQLTLLDLMKRRRLKKEINILDAGSKVGATAFAVIDYAAVLDSLCRLVGVESFFDKINMDFIEGSEDNVNVFKDNLSYFCARMKIYDSLNKFTINNPIEMNIAKKWDVDGYYDIIIFSNIIREMNYARRKQLIKEVLNNLNDNGVIIIIEPANKDNAAALNQLKYDAVNENSLSVLAPCGTAEKCLKCSIFRTEHPARSKLIDYFEDIYQGKHDDVFHNDRFKWIYTILSKNQAVFPSTDLSTLNQNEQLSCYFHIVSNLDRQKNLFKVCNCHNDPYEYYLNINNYPVENMRFGDFIHAENVVIKQGTRGRTRGRYITLESDSRITNLTQKRNNKRLSLDSVDEDPLKFLLKRIWGYDEFRKGQYDIIKNALQDISTLGILPTGAGKSLCFQLPAVLKPGVSIVVSPLKSLMKDQVDHLHRIGFEFADYIDSSLKVRQRKEIMNRFKGGFIKILYVSPERLQIQSFQQDLIELLKDSGIDYFIVDEAHCASEWGHDFRPSYLKIMDVVDKLNKPALLALTATASLRVRDDIVEIFRLNDHNVILPGTFDRPEISLEVVTVEINRSKADVLKDVLTNKIPQVLGNESLSKLHQKGSGIVFTIYADPQGENTRTYGTEHILKIIREWGVHSQRYHSSLSDDIRVQIQDQYIKDKVPLLVSTKGFGMGIDKPNIDYIIHMCCSNSLEAYYQEAGRAGRDNEHAHAVLIASLRHPKCIQNSKRLGKDKPLCASKWKCHFGGSVKCDYGMQAKFIEDEYPSEAEMKKDISRFIDALVEKAGGRNEFDIKCRKGDCAKSQKYLYYLQKELFVKDYFILDYFSQSMVIHIVLNKAFYRIPLKKTVDSITERLQNFKRQKYNMLASVWGYVSNDRICRRQYLMNYFGDGVAYEGGCGFCDIEGIVEERASGSAPDSIKDQLYKELHLLLNSEVFTYEKAYQLQIGSYKEGIHENIKIRSMRHLEDYPDNTTALYLSGIISFKRDSREVYGREQLYQCLKVLNKYLNISACREILLEIADIDEGLAFEIMRMMDFLFNDVVLLDRLITKVKDENIRGAAYLEYVNRQLAAINKKLEGGG